MKDDARLQQGVLDELNWDPGVQANAIGVEVSNGVVTLAGHVENLGQKRAAELAAQRVAGIKGIVVEIDVMLPAAHARKDEDLARAALHALDWNASVPKDAITVCVDNGWVTLIGEVDRAYQRAAALGAIRNLIGVAGISNEITLHAHPLQPDRVRKQILAALHRQAQLDADAVGVAVDGHSVILSGVVDSWSERLAAREAAWSARGVQQVIDNIEVAGASDTAAALGV